MEGRGVRGGGEGEGRGLRGVLDDFWLPKVSGATGKGKKGGQHFHNVVRSASQSLNKI